MAVQFKEMVERVVICCAGVCLEMKDLDDGLFPVKTLEEAAEMLLPQTPQKMKELMKFTFKPVKDMNDNEMNKEHVEEKRELIIALAKDRKLSEILSSQAHTLLSSQPPPHSPPPRSTATRWSDIIKLLSARVKEEMWCCEHHANLTVMPGTQDRGCGYFMWMDDLRLHISSSSGSSTPPSYSPGTSTRPSYSPGSSRSAQNLGKAECSNCKFLAEKIKTLEAKIKILEGALEMERHPEKHTLDSAAILHELYNEMGKLSME
ncbi:hypothetical protein Tco_0285150 [Tanacetum coccineum]